MFKFNDISLSCFFGILVFLLDFSHQGIIFRFIESDSMTSLKFLKFKKKEAF